MNKRPLTESLLEMTAGTWGEPREFLKLAPELDVRLMTELVADEVEVSMKQSLKGSNLLTGVVL